MKKNFYKAIPPYKTIQHIRDILYKTGIFLTEFSGSHGNFYHSHVVLASEGLPHLNISTNGKGCNPEYSLASAYAEMMERLQNNLKLYGEKYATKSFLSTIPENAEFRKRLEQEGSVLNYELFPDEKYITLEELLSNKTNICYKLYNKPNVEYLKKHYNMQREILCIPYYNVFQNKIEYLPAKNSHTGSNGMCAGNTMEESLVQGLCEIFERYALKQIFLNNFVPAHIPLNEFHNTLIYDKIMNLIETKNLEIIVLDCSLGMGLPVIGALIIDKYTKKYCVKMGAATDPETALERCLTEHFQANNPTAQMNDINNRSFYFNRSINEIKYINSYHQMIEGNGELDMPTWLYQEPNLPFKGFFHINGDNHKEELRELIDIVQKNNFELFIRDNSILQFPAFHIYVPGMSEIFNLLNEDDLYIELTNFDFNEKLFHIKNQNKEDILAFSNLRDQMYDKVRTAFQTFKGEFLYHINEEIHNIRPFLFLATLFYYSGETEKAIKYINRFIIDEKWKDKDADLTYYYCVKQYLELSISEAKSNIIIQKLKQIYEPIIVEEIASDLRDPDDALKYYNLPTCFECEKCHIKLDCRYFDVMKVVKNIHNNMCKDIDQRRLKELLQ